MKKYWFRRKRYGWGWVPSSWEGWVTMFVFVLAVVIVFSNIGSNEAAIGVLRSIIAIIILTLALIGVCFWKGEKPRWQWGNKD